MPKAVKNTTPNTNAPAPGAAKELDYRFALRPKWLVLHVLAVVGLVVMIVACFWQISRLHEKQDRNALYAARSEEPVESVASVVPPGATDDQVADARYRVLEARGRYLVDEQVFVRSRSLDGQPGAWVLTPLELEDQPGVAVVVSRGWIPASTTTPTLPAGAEAPTGPVTVVGLAMEGEVRSSFGSVDVSGADLAVLARLDLVRLQEQVEPTLLGVYLQLQEQQPAPTQPYPALVPPPPPDEGPHRSYAGQWAIFAVIWVFGYPMLVRRSAQRRAQDAGDAGRAGTIPTAGAVPAPAPSPSGPATTGAGGTIAPTVEPDDLPG